MGVQGAYLAPGQMPQGQTHLGGQAHSGSQRWEPRGPLVLGLELLGDSPWGQLPLHLSVDLPQQYFGGGIFISPEFMIRARNKDQRC